ncbi:MAG: prepilin-type N-terminal cleavage/methylation domain-containing protein [Chitinispirillaceae bacterium]|nr:prepilin-type N-terminal cleavage/methylation domain-containing protein [Chitinispirillaceae bacterium]
MGQCRKKNGFTFVEAIFVLAVIACVAAFVGPNMRPLLDNIRLRNAAGSIKYKLIMAKTRALGDSRIHCGVFFDTGTTPQAIYAFFDNPDAGNKGYYDPGIDTKYLDPYFLPPTITMNIRGTGTHRSIIFRGDGSTTANGVQLFIELKNGRQKNISVLPSTGRIKIATP